MCTHASYLHLSPSTRVVAVCALTGAVVHLLQFAGAPGDPVCRRVCFCVSPCDAVVLPGLQYALCLSFTRPGSVNRLLQERCCFLMGYPWQHNPFFLPMEEVTHSLSLSLFAEVVQHTPSFSPASFPPSSSLLLPLFLPSCQCIVRWEDSIPQCRSPLPCGSL